MKIQLNISYEDGYCGSDCMFREVDVLTRIGACLLFNEKLYPKIQYGDVEVWVVCDRCRYAMQNAKENEL